MVSAWQEPPNAKPAGVRDGMEIIACAGTETQSAIEARNGVHPLRAILFFGDQPSARKVRYWQIADVFLSLTDVRQKLFSTLPPSFIRNPCRFRE